MKYQSKEWQDAVKGASYTDREWRERSRGFTVRWQTLLLDCLGGVDKLIDWEVRNTQLTSVSMQEMPAPSKWRDEPVDTRKYLSRLVCPYKAHTRLHKQELTAMMAIGMGDYDIQGDITETIKRIEGFDAFLDLGSTIPAEYE